MVSLFAGIAVIAALGSLFFAERSRPKEGPSWATVAFAVLAAFLGYLAISRSQPTANADFSAAYPAGILAVLLTGLLEKFRKAPVTVSIGLGTLLAVLSEHNSSAIQTQAILAGLAIGGLVLGTDSAMLTAFAGGALVSLNYFAVQNHVTVADAAVKVGLLLTVASLAPLATKRAKAIPSAATAVAVALFLFVGVKLSMGNGESSSLVKLAFLPLIAGLAVHWLISDGDTPRSTSTSLVAGLVWLGGATLSFSLMRSTGLGLWLLLGAGVPLALGNSTAVGSAAPFAALTWYRLIQNDLTVGSDLSRFYVLTGLAAGVGLVAAGWEWRGRVDGLPGAIGGGLWALLAGGASILAGLVFGARGFAGSLEGSGLGSMLAGNHRRPVTPILLSAVMASMGALFLPTLQQSSPFGRDEKIKVFISCAAAILLIAGTLYALQIDRKAEPAK